MGVVATRARRGVHVSLTQQELPMPTRSEFRELISVQAVLPHLVGIGVTSRTDSHCRELVGSADEASAVGGRCLERRRIAAVTVVATNPSLGMDAECEGSSLVSVAHDATVRRVQPRAGFLILSCLQV